jgi:putative Mg2+ transporter-C (MgtC) family protein
MQLVGADGAVRAIAYVVSGIGFLGAGVIMKEGTHVRGLNIAATLWGSAAVGSCAGADMIAQAMALTVFVLAATPCCGRWSTPSTVRRWMRSPRRQLTMSA